ncbi:hypothetical protein [Blastococcus sp. TF02-8]|uniref:hypothetical protein n=1 Tax=Blastococcus sp. TF02-8 TaxID=2250574 RepID=UPI0011BE22BC|nr:hypothetical protein [Blastococcus sp. TF02-8]
MKHRAISVAMFVAFAAVSASPALAHSAVAPDSGSNAYDNSTHSRFYVYDMKADSHSAYGNWNNTDNRLSNNSGYGTTVSKAATVTAVRACTDVQFASDPCSNWN